VVHKSGTYEQYMTTTSRLEVPPALVLLQSCLTVRSYSGRNVIFQHRQNNFLFLMFCSTVFFTHFVPPPFLNFLIHHITKNSIRDRYKPISKNTKTLDPLLDIMKTSHKSDELKNLKKGGSTNRVPMILLRLLPISKAYRYTNSY
jgi:hypothetical protein